MKVSMSVDIKKPVKNINYAKKYKIISNTELTNVKDEKYLSHRTKNTNYLSLSVDKTSFKSVNIF